MPPTHDPLESQLRLAQRLVRDLAELESEQAVSRWAAGGVASDAALWVMGRAAEVEAFASDVAREARQGMLTRDAAAAALARYLRRIHEGIAARVGTLSMSTYAGAHDTSDANDVTTRTAPLAAAYAAAAELTSSTPRDE